MYDVLTILCVCGISISWGEAGAYAREWQQARGYDAKRAKYYKSMCLWATATGVAFAMAAGANIEARKLQQKVEKLQQSAKVQNDSVALLWKDAVQKAR